MIKIKKLANALNSMVVEPERGRKVLTRFMAAIGGQFYLRSRNGLSTLWLMKPILTFQLLLVFLVNSSQTIGQATDAPASEPSGNTAVVKNVEVDEAERLLKKEKNTVILDIRTPREFGAGHLTGAKNINFYEGDFRVKLQSLDKNKVYLLHCASGGRSAKAREMMKELHFKNIYHLEGGIRAWIKAGKSVKQ